MMKSAPEKKGFHFASDGIHFAEFIEAETIQEATNIYHKIKHLISAPETAPATGIAPAEQSTPPAPDESAPDSVE